jgi:3-hydroxyisobutyrate dehydrogenase-like beta-hydroxyacid dehydrogenase
MVGITALRDGPVPRLLEYKAEPMAHRDLTPMFTVDLMRKDLRLAGAHLPAGRLGKIVEEVFDAAAAAGRGGDDVVAIIEPLAAERSPETGAP